MRPIEDRCPFCEFAEFGEEECGDCHLNPPVIIVICDEVESCYPTIFLDGWCGQFKRKVH
jgi:hypothetical protein